MDNLHKLRENLTRVDRGSQMTNKSKKEKKKTWLAYLEKMLWSWRDELRTSMIGSQSKEIRIAGHGGTSQSTRTRVDAFFNQG